LGLWSEPDVLAFSSLVAIQSHRGLVES
jgi:hypothetical protein